MDVTAELTSTTMALRNYSRSAFDDDFMAAMQWSTHVTGALDKTSGAVCILGILGNLINIIVLTSMCLDQKIRRMERSANIGLLALSVSDLCYCVCIFPKTFVNLNKHVFANYGFHMLYVFSFEGVINTFFFTSTWLTVMMAVSRYLAICWPLHARQIISVKFAWMSSIVVFILAVVINVPRFFFYHVQEYSGMYLLSSTYLIQDKRPYLSYHWVSFILGVFTPFVCLATFNVLLCTALKNSVREQTSLRASSHNNNSVQMHRITAIFIAIIVCYLLLVIPGEIHGFLRTLGMDSSSPWDVAIFNVTQVAFELCQLINFSFNFLLYVSVNKSFQRKLRVFILCRLCQTEVEESETQDETSGVTSRLTVMPSRRMQRNKEPLIQTGVGHDA